MAKESGELQQLQAQRQKVQQALEELDQQKGSLEEQLSHIRQQTSQETQLVGLVEKSCRRQRRICSSHMTPFIWVTSSCALFADFITAVGARGARTEDMPV